MFFCTLQLAEGHNCPSSLPSPNSGVTFDSSLFEKNPYFMTQQMLMILPPQVPQMCSRSPNPPHWQPCPISGTHHLFPGRLCPPPSWLSCFPYFLPHVHSPHHHQSEGGIWSIYWTVAPLSLKASSSSPHHCSASQTHPTPKMEPWGRLFSYLWLSFWNDSPSIETLLFFHSFG